MYDPIIFDRNCIALSRCNSDLILNLKKADADPSLSIELSKTGKAVPIIESSGAKKALHSLFDPEREAVRLFEHEKHSGFIVAFGVGAGFLIREYLKSKEISAILIIEYNIELFKALILSIDLSDIFSDSRVRVIIDKEKQEITEELLLHYLPVISGNINSISLRSRVALSVFQFESAANAVHAAIDKLSDDFSVQSFFGKIWFKNIIRNLRLAEKPSLPLPPIKEAIVCAAGPSLEFFFDEIVEKRKGKFLIATDTTVPVFLERNIIPDAIISIDCQHISYYHFLQGIPRNIPLIVDLASPPLVTRLSDSLHFFSSGHPLCRYIASRWKSFPVLDTSGGNVTHAAVSLADTLGAKKIYLYGADFSYPEGKTYARGTYIYPYFYTRSKRTKTTETLFSDFLFRNSFLNKQIDAEGFRYLTKPLIGYRENMEALSFAIKGELIPVRGNGAFIKTRGFSIENKNPLELFASGRAKSSALEFLQNYKKSLLNLEIKESSMHFHLDSIDNLERDIWMTILPVSAAIKKNANLETLKTNDILSRALEYCTAIIDQMI